MEYLHLILALALNVNAVLSEETPPCVTQTVYGFLDFTTTIGSTVMIFSPQSAPELGNIPTNIIETKPFKKEAVDNAIKPTTLTVSVKLTTQTSKKAMGLDREKPNSITGNASNADSLSIANKFSTFSLRNKDESTVQSNSLYEYDLLSREPAEYAEETYRVINNKASTLDQVNNQNRNNPRRTYESAHTDGFVESASADLKVKGPQSSGRLASQQQSNVHKNKKSNSRSISSFRVLKTAAPLPPRIISQEQHLSRSSGSKLHSHKNGRTSENLSVVTPESDEGISQGTRNKKVSSRNKSKRKHKTSRAPTTYKPSSAIQVTSVDLSSRKSYRSKVKPSNVSAESSTSLYMFKLNRTPGRWQYKTTPKPRVTIRKLAEHSVNSFTSNLTKYVMNPTTSNLNQNTISEGDDLESSDSQNGAVINDIGYENSSNGIIETLNVEISTPADLKNTYYELVTIKTPYSFQVGGIKKSRFVTVTSTVEKTLTPETPMSLNGGPLTENILTPSPREINLIRNSNIVTLKVIHVSDNNETPSLETAVESFSTTHKKLRTEILPIVYDNKNETTYVTLVNTYDITTLITVTKTLSPLESEQFIPFKSFKDFGVNLDEAGSEINLELEFGDADNAEDPTDDKQHSSLMNPNIRNLIFVNRSSVHHLTNGNPTLDGVQKIETWALPDGSSTVTPYFPNIKKEGTIPFPSIPQQASLNPFLLPIEQNFQTITSSVIHKTVVTQTQSKVLRLTFGAKTAYTTLISSEIVPTMLTMYITTSIAVQPTAAFPGFFPPAYPQFAYIG